MKPLFAFPFVVVVCLLTSGCGRAEVKKPGEKSAPTAAAIEQAAPSKTAASKAAPSAAAPSKVADHAPAVPASSTANDSASAETNKPPVEDDPFPNGEPK